MTIPESRLFNFIDSKNEFTISFLEGQKVIHDIAIIHDVKNLGFHFFRNSLLSTLQLMNYLKPQENLGFFIDSENPYFRFKIEMNNSGQMRTLLLPETFDELPNIFNGKVRLSKMFPNSPSPYTSIVEVKGQGISEVINDILKDSYQVHSHILMSETSDQSVMISRLPDHNVDKEEVEERLTLEEYIANIKNKVDDIFAKNLTKIEDVQNEFTKLGFNLLTSREVSFKCNCSRDRMVTGIAGLAKNHNIDEVFEGKDSLEAKCDYCKTTYLITKEEIQNLFRH
jgi:molecular chaperone Hsp33